MGSSRFGLCGRVALVVLSSLLLALTAHAKQGFFLGGGTATQSVSGGLDGKKAFIDSTDTVAILAGKPDSGSGLGIDVGYGFTPQVSVDWLLGMTSHTAKHSLASFSSNMSLTASLLGVKLNVPVMENLEIVGRVGLATATATYSKYGLEGSNLSSGGTVTSTTEAKFSGSGFGFGAGVEYFIDKVSLSANYSLLNVSFDEASGGGASGTLSSSLSSSISQITFLVTYYFQ